MPTTNMPRIDAPQTDLPRIDMGCVVSCNPDTPFSPLDEDMLAIDERAGYCYSLNSSAARIWHLALTPTSVGEICAVLCKEFAVDHETCVRDVSELLFAMRDAGLIKVADAAMD
jgi:hypothetical protein